MSLFCCPLCGEALTAEPGRYFCPAGHSFDRSREGYVHLLPANRKHSKQPGDDKGMAQARNRFLSGGWYGHLSELLCRLSLETQAQETVLLDSGCGEGYYTQQIARAFAGQGRGLAVGGIDLSKASLRMAARRLPGGEFALASAYHLPVGNERVDLLLNCFSPLALKEFERVLRPGGRFLYVVPGPNHLWELKRVLYDKPYPNGEQSPDYPGFTRLKVEKTERKITLRDAGTMVDLFHMTPYYWKTPAAGAQRLNALDELTVTAAFAVHVYEKQR